MLKGVLIGFGIFLIIDTIIGLILGATYKGDPIEPKKPKKQKGVSEDFVKATMYLGFMPLSFFGTVRKVVKQRKAAKKLKRGLFWWYY